MSSDLHFTYVRDFIACIAPGETQFVFQAIQDPQPRSAHSPLIGTLEQCYETLQRDNAQRYGIYWQPNPGPGRLYGDITGVRALFLDFDTGGLPALPLPPHCVVETSPGKFQAYWRVSDCALDQFDVLLGALADRWHSDANAKGRNRLFRVAGFTHNKAEPFVSRVASWAPGAAPYSVQQIRDGLLPGWVEPVRQARAVTQQDWDAKTDTERAAAVDHIKDALSRIPADDHALWIEVGHALAGLGDLGLELWDEWSQKSAKYQGIESLVAAKVAGTRTGYASLFNKALQYDPTYLNPASIAAKVRDMDVAGVFGCAPMPDTASPIAPPVAAPAPQAIEGQLAARPLTFAAAAEGSIRATSATVADALLSVEGQCPVAFDEFLGRPVISRDGQWRPIRDTDIARLRVEFERRGFKAVSKDAMDTAIGSICDQVRFDSAIEWANTLTWDGVKRVTGSLARYYRTKDTPYTRAAAEYLWTALAGRCLSPGCQADMAIILVGLQGARKTSAVSAMAPFPSGFGKANLGQRDENLSRKIKGKLVVELPELRGIGSGRDVQGIRDWMTTRDEAFVDKYEKFESNYARRFVCVGTANEDEVLDDIEGERRWLPMRVGAVDVEALERDRDQLWAEGIAMWREGGIRWQAAETLARDEHAEFKVGDEWTQIVADWLEQPCNTVGSPGGSQFQAGCRKDHPIRIADVLVYGLRVPVERVSQAYKLRVAKILTSLNYRCHVEKNNGRSEKVYRSA